MSEKLEKSRIFDGDRYKMAHKTYNTLDKLFNKMKDKISKFEESNLIYKIPCGGSDTQDCDKVYIGTTKNKLKTRISGHKSDQKYRYNSTQKTALSSHCMELNHYPKFENTLILSRENNYKRRFMLEMLHIINTPMEKRINFKTDVDNIAQSYRYLVNRGNK